MAKCEWDPTLNGAAADGSDTACANDATVVVGGRGEWHLCAQCAELPPFQKFRKREFLERRDPGIEPRKQD